MTSHPRLALVALLAVAVGLFYASGLPGRLTVDAVQLHQAALQDFVSAHRWIALAAFVALFAAVTGALIPVALILTLAGGFLFGAWFGALAVVLGATLGALLTYWAVRTSAGDWLRRRQAGRWPSRLTAVMEGVRRRTFFYVLSLRLIPLAPFGLVNVAAGMADAPVRPYAAATFLGAIPTSLIYCHLGAGLERVFVDGAALNAETLREPQVFWPLLALAVLALAPAVVGRRSRPRAG